MAPEGGTWEGDGRRCPSCGADMVTQKKIGIGGPSDPKRNFDVCSNCGLDSEHL